MPYSLNSLIDIIEKNKQKKQIATKIIESDPKNLSVLPKLITSSSSIIRPDKDKEFNNYQILNEIFNKIKNLKENNTNIIKLFPDIELAIQILVSSILSPKKMTDIKLNYKLNKNFSNESIVLANILNIIKDYITLEYEIEEKLPDILREALFESGAYIISIIPESTVDEIINTDIIANFSTEEFKQKSDYIISSVTKPINILKNKKIEINHFNSKIQSFLSLLLSEENIRITDNFNILKFNKIKEKITQSVLKKSLKFNSSISTESLNAIDYLDIFRVKENTSYKNIEYIKNKNETKRKSIGKPMIIKIPTESVIPVIIPGDKSNHIGYFVLLDENGKPLNIELKNTDTLNNINYVLNLNSNTSNLSSVQKAYKNLIYDNTLNIDFNQLFELYKNVIETQLYNSIKNSLYGSNIEIANKNDIYFIMFCRALANQKTNLLFIPKELLVYFAFYYNELGIGKSLLENLSILSSLRAILLFSKTMAFAKQAIDVTKVNVSLDPNDPDPEKTIEQIQDSVLRLRQNYFPLGINNPIDLVNWVQRAGLQFYYENNPLLPNVKIDFENVNIQHTIPSSDLEEELRKQTIIALGLSPETIDNGFSPEFATTIVANNILLSKRISIYQNKLKLHLSKFVSMILINDEELRNKLRKFIMENIDTLQQTLDDNYKQLLIKNSSEFIEYFIDKLAENIEITLPKPEITNINNLSAEFELYKENLDKVIDSTISTEIFSENISGELSTYIETIKNIYKHYLLRKWMSDNNYYTEVLKITNTNKEEIDGLLETISNHLIYTNRNSVKLLTILQKFKEAINSDIRNLEESSINNVDNSLDSSNLNTEEKNKDNEDMNFNISESDTDLNF